MVEPALAAAQQIAKSTWNGHLGTARLFAEMLRRLTSTECKTNLNASVLLLRVAPTCPEGQHQDAQEYLQLLFECIDKAWCNPFCVQMQSSIQCCFCGHSSQPAVTAADFMVPMDVRASVQDAIDAFSEPSHQSAIASDRYRCPRKCPRSSALALKDAKLRHPPLRRWSQTRIDLVEQGSLYRLVYLKRFADRDHKDSTAVHLKEQHTFASLNPQTKEETRSIWAVTGVVVHSGHLHGGHYGAYTRGAVKPTLRWSLPDPNHLEKACTHTLTSYIKPW